MANRPATCASCGKRLSKKQWYYRNGQFFCTKRCWTDVKSKSGQPQPSEPTAAA